MLYDFAIVGAGLVGASLAVALKDCGLKIALIDAANINPSDKRLFALNISSVQFLKNIGVWSLIDEKASPIQCVHVSKRKRFGIVQLRAEEVNLSTLGYMMPAKHIEAALASLFQGIPMLDCYRPMQLTALKERDDAVNLSLENHDKKIEIAARYVIGADGTQSTVRQLIGFDTKTEDYQETAIVAEILLNVDHQNIAYERFYESGVLAMLPLKDKTFAMILTAKKEDAIHLLAMTDDAFLAHIQHIFGHRAGKLASVSERASYPLRLVLSEKAATQKILLLGNALHTIHPVAAQGFNLALYEVASLIDAIKQSNALKINCMDIESSFKKQQAISINVSRELLSITHHSSFLSGIVMQCGMIAFEALPFVKRQFLKAMLGRLNQLPTLMCEAD